MYDFIFSFLGFLIQSRIGQLTFVAVVSWFISAHETTVKYEKIISAEKAAVEAAYNKEILREQFAAKEIAEAATRRAEDDAATVKEMQAIIDGYDKTQPEQKDEKLGFCDIDADFARVVQQLRETSYRHPRASRPSARLR